MGVLEDNVNSRRDAEEVMDLIGDRSQRFWECIVEMARAKLPRAEKAPARDPAMNEAEATRFERAPWPWSGISKGVEIGRVDPEYIARCVDGTDFDKMLRRYVKSERFKKRIAEHEAPSYVTRRDV